MPPDHDPASLQQAIGLVCGLTGASSGAAEQAVRRDAAARGESPEAFAETLLRRWSAALRGEDAAPRRRPLGPLLDDAMGRALSQPGGDAGVRHRRGSADELAELTGRLRDRPGARRDDAATAPGSGRPGDGPGLSTTESADLAEALGLPGAPEEHAAGADPGTRHPPPPGTASEHRAEA